MTGSPAEVYLVLKATFPLATRNIGNILAELESDPRYKLDSTCKRYAAGPRSFQASGSILLGQIHLHPCSMYVFERVPMYAEGQGSYVKS